VEQANAVIAEAIGNPERWTANSTTQLSRNPRGLYISDASSDGFVWSPWIDVPAAAVAAVEISILVKANTPLEATTLQLWWKGVDSAGQPLAQYEHREIQIHSDWGAADWAERPYRVDIGADPRWRRFASIRRLRIDPSPSPFGAVLGGLRLVGPTE
jgi:hypothetical protein